MCGAPERLTAFGAHTFLVLSQQYSNGSRSTVVKTVELGRVVYRVAEPGFNIGETYVNLVFQTTKDSSTAGT
jgi:hypothetical protein